RFAARADRDLRAFACKSKRCGAPHPLARAGNQGYFAFQSQIHSRLTPWQFCVCRILANPIWWVKEHRSEVRNQRSAEQISKVGDQYLASKEKTWVGLAILTV